MRMERGEDECRIGDVGLVRTKNWWKVSGALHTWVKVERSSTHGHTGLGQGQGQGQMHALREPACPHAPTQLAFSPFATCDEMACTSS